MHVFTQIFAGKHLLNVESFCFGPATWYATEKHYFGVLGFVGKSASDGNGFRNGRISTQFELARVAEFAAGDEVWFFEILKFNIDDWLMKKLCVSLSQRFSQFWEGL